MIERDIKNRTCAGRIAQITAGALALLHVSAWSQSEPAPSGPGVQRNAQEQSDVPDTKGSGRFPALKEEVASLPRHVVYRPEDLSKLRNEK